MIEYVKYEKRWKYPHMGPLDAAIWERFIEKFPNEFEQVAYDIAVGEGTPMDTVVSPDTGGDVNRLYQRRIDVVGVKGASVTIIECKPRATTAAIGQIKGYALLFARDFSTAVGLKKVIVTDELMPEMKFLADSEGVGIVVV